MIDLGWAIKIVEAALVKVASDEVRSIYETAIRRFKDGSATDRLLKAASELDKSAPDIDAQLLSLIEGEAGIGGEGGEVSVSGGVYININAEGGEGGHGTRRGGKGGDLNLGRGIFEGGTFRGGKGGDSG